MNEKRIYTHINNITIYAYPIINKWHWDPKVATCLVKSLHHNKPLVITKPSESDGIVIFDYDNCV